MAVIPRVDMSDTLSEHRHVIIHQLAEAAHSYGFFVIYNHGISAEVMKNTVLAFRRFHEQPSAIKKQFIYLSPSFSPPTEAQLQSFMLEEEQNRNVYMNEKLVVRLAPYVASDVPDICGRELHEWDTHMQRIGKSLLGLLSQGLGAAPNKLMQMGALVGRIASAAYYPFDLNKVLSMPAELMTLSGSERGGDPGSMTLSGPHRDPFLLKVMLQDQPVTQFKVGEDWLEVLVGQGELLVTIGDLFQIISNDNYKSVQQCVLSADRTVHPILCSSHFHPFVQLGPLEGLVELNTPPQPPHYRRFSIDEYADAWRRGEEDLLEKFRQD